MGSHQKKRSMLDAKTATVVNFNTGPGLRGPPNRVSFKSETCESCGKLQNFGFRILMDDIDSNSPSISTYYHT